MPRVSAQLAAAAVVALQAPTAARATIFQNRLFSDHMVLQSGEAYDVRPFVAGWGDTPGESVAVQFGTHEYTTTVGADLTWEVQMNSCKASTGNTLRVVGASNTLTYTDVSCGQVYLCSGQSNMGLPLSYVFNSSEEIAAATMANFRLFQVPLHNASAPQRDLPSGAWTPLSPQSVPGFSAVCYLTAFKLARMYLGSDMPFGLIESAYGGTRVEAWSPLSTNETCAHTAGPAPAPMPGSPQEYASLYNAMIAPLVHYTIRAAFWFQGEHNVVTGSSRERYACTFANMVNLWRDAWRGVGDYPFMTVQLAPYTGYSPFPGHGDTSTIRLAQADALPHIGLDTTGMAVAIDLGDPTAPAGDVHSRHKEEVAHRLALASLHVVYALQEGELINNTYAPVPNPVPLHYSGPVLRDASFAATTATTTLAFDFAGEPGSALVLNDTLGCSVHRGIDFHGNPIGGECCAAHDTFQLCSGSAAVNNTNTTFMDCANATGVTLGTDGTVTLTGTAPGGVAPTVVRHAYANYPQCSLQNSYALPASPFLAPVAVVQQPRQEAKEHATSDAIASRLSQRASDGKVAAAGATPPMGVNSWNSFHCNVDERKMRGMADALVSTGLAAIGYNFLNIDDCWQVQRTPNGTIRADPARFPGGIKPLVDYAHSKGVKFGIYSAQKEFTCQRRPGSYQHEAQDVQSYCDWGIDYIKLDQCAGAGWPALNESWMLFRAAIDKHVMWCVAARPDRLQMVLSVESCDDPFGCGTWVGNLANLWRTSGDIQATFASVMTNAAENTRMAEHQGPRGGPAAGGGGRWNDADMLQVGDIGLSEDEQSSHFSLWALMASPLLIGADITALDDAALMILNNTEVVAVNQDALGVQGVPVGHGKLDPATAPCWAKKLANGDLAVLLLNTGGDTATVVCTLEEVGVSGAASKVRDIIGHKDLGPVTEGGQLSASLPTHAHAFFRVTPTAGLK